MQTRFASLLRKGLERQFVNAILVAAEQKWTPLHTTLFLVAKALDGSHGTQG